VEAASSILQITLTCALRLCYGRAALIFANGRRALENGAFDVLDAVYEQSRVVEATKCALWAAYLKGAGPSPRVMSSSRVGLIAPVRCVCRLLQACGKTL